MWRYILASVIVISAFVSADAASLFGKVIEVSSGDVITIHNLNRPVRVKLMGVAAPEMNQAFGDVAKKHLADLVFEKAVVVEYAGIAADSSLTGRVLLNDADIGAQMIRDGVAWFDLRSGDRLSATVKEVYEQSEQAARREKRGLWQQESPVAPWEFVKAERIQRDIAATMKTIAPDAKPRRSGPVGELNNLSLMTASMNAAPAQTSPSGTGFGGALSTTRKNWSVMQPPGEDFSVNIPEEGERRTASVPIGDQMVDLNMYMVRDGWAGYSLTWLKRPNLGESDDPAANGPLKEYIKGVAEGYKYSSGPNSTCEPRTKKLPPQSGYTAVELDMSSCRIPTRIRMYTKIVDDQRQVYVATVTYTEAETENATRFLKSFTLGVRAH